LKFPSYFFDFCGCPPITRTYLCTALSLFLMCDLIIVYDTSVTEYLPAEVFEPVSFRLERRCLTYSDTGCALEVWC